MIEIDPQKSDRYQAYMLWLKAPNPMVTFFKTLDITNLVKLSKKKKLKFTMLFNYCIGKAAHDIKEFYTLPVGEKLIKYDTIAVNTIVKNSKGSINSCDILYCESFDDFAKEYIKNVSYVAKNCVDKDLTDSMVIGTSAVIDTELDGVVGMNSGIYNNPFMFWGRYRKKFLKYYLPVSFQFHHTQMDGAHAGRFLENLQNEINKLKL